MKRTGLTLGGFIQPSIAQNLLEQHASVEKGLCQRLLWCVPKHSATPFEELEKVDRNFSASLGNILYVRTCTEIHAHIISYKFFLYFFENHRCVGTCVYAT